MTNNESLSDVCVIGAGPAGLMASIFAARQGASVCVIERNASAGRKLLMTGGGRCNLTHACTTEEFLKRCSPYGNLLKPAMYTLPPDQLLDFFRQRGLQTQTEPDGCVFPVGGTASSVRRILLEQVVSAGVSVLYNQHVESVRKDAGRFVVRTQQGSIAAAAVIVATGGVSWPRTGSSGDGYTIAETFGHTVAPPVGILCPVVCEQQWLGALQGTAIPQVTIRVKTAKRTDTVSGAMVFTENGLGGPAAFDVSRLLADGVRGGEVFSGFMDFCPEQTEKELEARLINLCAANPKKEIDSILATLLPRRLAEQLTATAFGQRKITAAHLSKKERFRLVRLIKQTPLTFTGCGTLEKATVTRGGVNNKEVNFKTMQSRLCEGLYFAGEVMDIDGPCGGYNLQIAFSTGALAGTHAATSVTAGSA